MTGTVLCAVGDNCRGTDLAGDQIPPRDIWDGGYLCNPCRNRLGRWIAEIPGQWDDLALVLANGGQTGDGRGSRIRGLELNDAVAQCRDRIVASLCGWARVVCEDRGISRPRSPNPHAVAVWLLGRNPRAGHVEWLAHQPFAVEPYHEIGELRREAWRLANPSGRRRFTVAPCPADTCNGTLIAWLALADDLFPSVLACDTCDLELPSGRWVSVLVKGRVA